ncbi:hypothetical protein UNPF46_17910 [Bradyrhizobium sp. UNPF46]|uniref:hypothetical protein n=1 Tax=Bradyrhizobium sp. UNPF46 TaxID=1141168 RepID=UPI00115302E4|nr:hypothetical protein [Bradyrhizobium sp. UNPF46]TQF37845.1 hypothetical protein UNPF46_17910 [Bradyrhizobium sp. UNPF46]
MEPAGLIRATIIAFKKELPLIRYSRTTRLSVAALFLAAASIVSAARAGDYREPKSYAPVTDPAKKTQIHNDGAAGAMTPYPNSCLPFPELVAAVQKRIAALQNTN